MSGVPGPISGVDPSVPSSNGYITGIDPSAAKAMAGPIQAVATQPAASQLPVSPASTQVADPAAERQRKATAHDRLDRMLKARADALQKPVLDDQGNVAIEPHKPVDALRTSIRAFSGYVAGNPEKVADLKDYLEGRTDTMPDGWIPDDSVRPSQATLHQQTLKHLGDQARKDSPYWSAAADAASVAGGYAGAFAQGVTDLGVGVANRLGGNIAPVNVKAKLRAFAQSVAPWGEATTEQQAADEIAAMEGTQNGIVDVLRRSTEVVGNVHQMMGGGALGLVGKAGKAAKAAQAAQKVGVVGKTVNAITNVTGAPFRAAAQLGQFAGKLSPMASAAAGFAAHSALTAAPGQAVEAAKEGAVSGAIMGVMGEMGRGLYRYILKQPAAKMGIDGKNASETLKKWAADNGVFRAEVETAENYSKRLLNSWIDGGMQGAPRISMDKVRAIAAQGAFEGVGFSALDVEFREQIMAGIAGHDVNWGEVAKIYSANFLGTVGMHVPLRDIPGFQRRDWADQTGDAPKPQEPAKAQDAPQGPQKETGASRIAEMAQGTPEQVQANKLRMLRQRMEARAQRAGFSVVKPHEKVNLGDQGMGPIQGFDSSMTPEQIAALPKVDVNTAFANEQRNINYEGMRGEQPQPRPESIDYYKDDSQRQHYAEQAKTFEGDVKIKVGSNAAQQALQFIPQRTKAYKQLKDIADNKASGTVDFTADEARKFVDYHARSAPRRRTSEDIKVSQPKIKAIDSIAEKLLTAYGKPLEPPRGEATKGPDGPMPQRPIGIRTSGDAPMEAEARTGPDEAPVEMEMVGTPFDFRIEGGQAWASPKLEDALNIDSPMPADKFQEVLEQNTLMALLAAKENLPGVEISSDQGVYATEDGVMRKIVPGGDVVESPLQPNPVWTRTEKVPVRGKDPIPLEQQQLADACVGVVNGREDLLEADRHMLSQLAETMNTVSAQNDRSVAETVAMAGPFLEQIINGDPVQAGKAIKGLAEMMTIKAPEVVMREMQQQESQPSRVAGKPTGSGPKRTWTDESGDQRTDWGESMIDPNNPPTGIDFTDADFVNQGGGVNMWRSMGADEFAKLESGDITYGGKAAGRGNYLSRYPEKAARISEDGKVLVEFGGGKPKGESSSTVLGNRNIVQAWRRVDGQWEPINRKQPRGDDNPDGYGPAQVGMGVPVPPEVVAGLKTTGRGAKGIVEKGWNYFQQSLMKRAESAGLGGKLGGIIRKAVTNTRKNISGHSDAGLFDLKRTDRKAQRALGEEILSDKYGGHTTLYYAKTDKDAAGYFGEGRSLTPEEQKVIDTSRGTISHGARIAEEQGVKFRNLDGGEERGITYDPNRKIGPRVPTSVMTDATMNRRGPVWDALVKWFGDARGKTVEEVTQEYVNRSSAVSFDPTEHVRFERVIPTRITVEGKIVKLFEDTPVEHAEKLAWRNAHIMGAISAIPREAAKKREPGTEYRSEVTEALPENAQQLLNEIQDGFGKDAAREAEGIIRSLHGMAIRNDPSWAGTPGTDTHTAIKVIGDAFGVMKALALSASSVVNIPEPIANAPLLTLKAITNGYGTILRAFKDKSLGTMHRDLVSEGFLVDSKENIPHGSDGLMEKWDENLQKSKELLMTPMRLLQDANELILASAAKERLGAMQRGEGVDNDLAALKLLGFQANEAMAMIQGKGSPEMYAEYKNRIVSNLTGGKGLHGVEKSMAAHSRGFNAIVWFSNFFQARSRAATAVYERFREAPDFATKKDAAMQLASFAGFTALSGLLGNIIKKWVLGDDAGDYLHEMVSGATTGESVTNGLSSFAQLVLSGTLGGAGQLISDPMFGPAKEGQSSMRIWSERLGGLFAPLGTVAKGADFLGALRGQDVPGYEGKTGWQALAKYITNVAPLARGLDKGLFGLGVLAITEKDKDLDDAQDSYYRWLFKNAPPDGGDRSELGKEWRDSMRKVVDQVQAGKSYGDEDLMDALVEAQMAHVDKSVDAAERSMELGEKPKPVSVRDAKTAMAASLRARQFFSAQKMSKLTAEQVKSLQAHLGEENVARLKDYDTILEALAKRVSPTRRF